MGIGHKLLSILSGTSGRERREAGIERDPKAELLREARSGGDMHLLAEEDRRLLEDFKTTVNAQFDTLGRGREDVVRVYNLIVRYLRTRRRNAGDPSVGNEYHMSLQSKHKTQFRYVLDKADTAAGSSDDQLSGHEISLKGLQSQLLTIAAKNRDAVKTIHEIWVRHPLFDRRELRPVRSRIKARLDAWNALYDLAHGLTMPYPLKAAERIIEVLVGYRLDMEVPYAQKYVDVEKDSPGERTIIVDMKLLVDEMRSKTNDSFDALSKEVAAQEAVLFNWKTA